MRQVDTCDFCGDAPDGVFEVVPAANPSGPVRLALCDGCKTTLETVTDPLRGADDHDGAATDTDHSGSDPAADSPATPPTSPQAASSDAAGITIEDSTDDAAASRPDGYAQVLRLLENRDDDMPRGDLRALATNAYGLTADSFQTAVDAAIENGDVAADGDGLRRT
ncbi:MULTISPECIES: hypothetical protein [Halobacterium]|uniref:hypothetical protein n=1 Tax=Halobacterium TaxID=2239 RepID=UPI001964DCF5|nr:MULTISPECIES: hypothetical protein [Halobacterium]MCF2164415.1 hypothetical protein [Halobacterium salinarum]MCF2167202.1 hypothetical protein [Halobacterium salinarum]MCF2238466.1 hypothetical protein [Halobacterium salinarum]MDL0128620.1 hypothetical protein [Halobacterium salinarum]MDL0144568.1 hypothetical protein [Halobacterium salinarum]